jgi:hypothetical protein
MLTPLHRRVLFCPTPPTRSFSPTAFRTASSAGSSSDSEFRTERSNSAQIVFGIIVSRRKQSPPLNTRVYSYFEAHHADALVIGVVISSSHPYRLSRFKWRQT